MRKLVNSEKEYEEANYRLPVPTIFAAVLLLIFALLLAAIMHKSEAGTEQLPGQANQSQISENAAEAYAALKVKEEAVLSREEAAGLKEKDLAEKEKILSENTEILKETAKIRADIINKLEEKLSSLNLPIEINKATGNIRFTEAVLFDINKDTLNTDGQKNLKIFAPAYISVLLDNEYEKYLDQIIVEGHADNGGTYGYNLTLSQNRANSVMEYILSQKLTDLPGGFKADKYFTISARSFNVPVLVNGVADQSQSRRVEFAFRLKDDEILEKLHNQSLGE